MLIFQIRRPIGLGSQTQLQPAEMSKRGRDRFIRWLPIMAFSVIILTKGYMQYSKGAGHPIWGRINRVPGVNDGEIPELGNAPGQWLVDSRNGPCHPLFFN